MQLQNDDDAAVVEVCDDDLTWCTNSNLESLKMAQLAFGYCDGSMLLWSMNKNGFFLSRIIAAICVMVAMIVDNDDVSLEAVAMMLSCYMQLSFVSRSMLLA